MLQVSSSGYSIYIKFRPAFANMFLNMFLYPHCSEFHASLDHIIVMYIRYYFVNIYFLGKRL